jgi:hypothetical protein
MLENMSHNEALKLSRRFAPRSLTPVRHTELEMDGRISEVFWRSGRGRERPGSPD